MHKDGIEMQLRIPNCFQTATARVRNAFGGAETLEGNMSFGTRTKSNFAVCRAHYTRVSLH